VRKFQTLTDGIITAQESQRFLDAAQRIPDLAADDLVLLNVEVPKENLAKGRAGIL
jgi:2-methylcitrate dehydratase